MNEPVAHLEALIQGDLRDRLERSAERCAEVELAMSKPDAQDDRAGYVAMLEEHAQLVQVVRLFKEYESALEAIEEAEELIGGDDAELRELAESEIDALRARVKQTARAVREHLLDEEDGSLDRCIVEIRAGAGGDEAALFAADLFGMYAAYCERVRWKIEILDQSETPLGGFKEIMFSVHGKRAFSRLRYESGGHRVQRVPQTETQGRIHTSAVTVAVLEEVEEQDIQIDEKDLRIDTFCASGPGGQKVNKTSSAVRITHEPTGTVVSIQDEKSQHRNKAKAMLVLASRLREHEERERREKSDSMRRSLIGSGDRSDRIRTYNFPQNRCTDHRIGLTLYNLDRVIVGEIDELLDRLEQHDREERVQNL